MLLNIQVFKTVGFVFKLIVVILLFRILSVVFSSDIVFAAFTKIFCIFAFNTYINCF